METVEPIGSGVLEAYDAREAAADKEIGDLLRARQHPIQHAVQQLRGKKLSRLIVEATRRYLRRITR